MVYFVTIATDVTLFTGSVGDYDARMQNADVISMIELLVTYSTFLHVYTRII